MYTGSPSASDLFERTRTQHTGAGNEGTYSPLETLVRQTSLRGGWRVKGGSANASPSPAGHSLDRRAPQVEPLGVPLARSGKSRTNIPPSYDDEPSEQRSYSGGGQQLTPDRYLNQPAQGSRRGRPPSSPLLHTQFRQSTATSLNDVDGSFLDTSFDASGVAYSVGDSTLDASTSTAGGGYFSRVEAAAKPPIAPLRLPNRLTIDDTMTDREQYRWDSDDNESPLDGPGRVSSYTHNILPPSFEFPEDDELELTSPSIRDGGRPLSDRSFVLPPSVKGLSIRHKSGLSSHNAASGSGARTEGVSPISPAQMSFYSESSYSYNSSGNGPPSAVPSLPQSSSLPRHQNSANASFLPSPSDPSSSMPPSSARDPRPSSSLRPSTDAPSESSESSVYDDTAEVDSQPADILSDYLERDSGELDFAAALESSSRGRWAPSPSPNLDPGGTSDATPTLPAPREEPMPAIDSGPPRRMDSKKTRQSDLEPFAFRHYEGRKEDIAARAAKPKAPVEPEYDDGLYSVEGEPEFNMVVHSSSPTKPHYAPTSVMGLSTREGHTHSDSLEAGQELDVSPQPSPSASPVVSSYPYLPSPTHSPVVLPDFNGSNESGYPVEHRAVEGKGMLPSTTASTITPANASHSPLAPSTSSPPAPTTSTVTMPPEPEPLPDSPSTEMNRAPSLVAAAIGSKGIKKFNFSRPMRSSIITSASLNAVSPMSASYEEGLFGGQFRGVMGDFRPSPSEPAIRSASGLDEREEVETNARQSEHLYANIIAVLPVSPPSPSREQAQPTESQSPWDYGSPISLRSPDMPNIPDIQITNHRTAPSSQPPFKSASPIRPELYRASSGSALSSASRGSAATGEESMRYYMALESKFPAPPGSPNPVVVLDSAPSTGGMAGVGRGRIGLSSPGLMSPQGPPSPGMLTTPEMFSSPRAAPRPPSPSSPMPNNNARSTSPYRPGASPLSPNSSPYSGRVQPHSPMMLPGSTSTATITVRHDATASPSPSRLAPRAYNAPSPNPSATTLVNGLSPSAANGRPEALSNSRLSLYSNYSFYGVPDSPGASPHQSSTNLASSGGRRPTANNAPRSPGGLSPMNPYQDSQGRLTPSKQQPPQGLWTPMLSPAQLTPEGLYQPQYVADNTGLEGQRSLFRRKKNKSHGSGGSLPNLGAGGGRGSDGSYFPAGAFGEKLSQSPTDSNAGLPQASTAEEYLQLGITHHEADSLALSAYCFEQAATLGGGCGFGMLMWGLTLRHGWGVKKDERMGFAWVKQAADAAVGDLEATVEGVEADAVRNELVLAIFEVGQCYSKGWGVKEDKKLAFGYFQVAARLGDSDAQQELGFCYANGKGCKKDKKEAAKWYRAAVAQGVSTVGLAWIFKEKYDS